MPSLLRSYELQCDSCTIQYDCIAVCFRKQFPTIPTSRKAAIISLAHLTSWSAERIAKAVVQNRSDGHGQPIGEQGAAILAEEVWDLYRAWVEHLFFCTSELDDMEKSMCGILKQFKIDPSEPPVKGRNLASTPRPVRRLTSNRMRAEC